MSNPTLIRDDMISSEDSQGVNNPSESRPGRPGWRVKTRDNGALAIIFNQEEYPQGVFIKDVKPINTENIQTLDVIVVELNEVRTRLATNIAPDIEVPVNKWVWKLIIKPTTAVDGDNEDYVIHVLVDGCFKLKSEC
jgi:hypothetical protein